MSDRQTLKPGVILDNEYEIRGVLGQGGFGVTYDAHDIRLETRRAIKEFFPHDMSRREGDRKIAAYSGIHNDQFEWGRARFVNEGKLIARFSHPSIVKVIRIFDENNTAYMVLDFVEGETLEKWAARNPYPSIETVQMMQHRLLDALELIHSADILHRDISPDNIMLRSSGDPVYIDFGAAKSDLRTRPESKVSYITYRDGYSPPEQHWGTSQGAWTDIYALGATLYRVVTGQVPPSGVGRGAGDTLVPSGQLVGDRYPANMLAAIDKSLRLQMRDRPQSVADWRREFVAGAPDQTVPISKPGPVPVPPVADPDKTEVAPPPDPNDRQGRAWWGWPGTRRPQADDTGAPPPPPQNEGAMAAAEAAGWSTASTGDCIASLRSYLAQYPAGAHRPEAETRIAARLQSRQIRSYLGHQGAVHAVAVSADGLSLLSGGADTLVRRWDVKTGVQAAAYKAHTRPIRQVAFLPDANFAVSAGDDRSVRLWSLAQSSLVRSFDRHDSEVLSLAVTADGLGIVTGTRFRSVLRWDLNSGRPLNEFNLHDGAVTAIATALSGQHALSGGHDKLLRLHTMPSLGMIRPLGILADSILSIAISPDSTAAAVGCADGGVYVWDLRSTGGPADSRPVSPRLSLRGHDGGVRAVAFSGDGSLIASCGRDGTLRLWQAQTGNQLLSVNVHRDTVHALAASATLGAIATAGGDGQVRLWDVSDFMPPR